MRLTKTQETILANRFWQRGENYLQAVLRKGFDRLNYSQFYKIINAKRPKGNAWKGPKTPEKRPYIKNQEFNSCFMAMTEDEQLKFRKGLPIPEETLELFRIGRLAAYYSNPIYESRND